MKKAQESKTIWFGFALILLDTVPEIQELLVQFFPEIMAQYGLAIVGVVTVGLRLFTRQPINLRGK